MLARKFTLGVGTFAAVAASICLFSTSAFADYGPSSNDVVGVGSDTVQAAGNFVGDGDFLGDPGYNTTGNLNKFISIDATADANTRLAYGSPGVGSGSCVPGTGATTGTGNANANHADSVCTLNPTVVLRAGTSPVQRPNGSGAGYNLLKADTDTTTGKSINGLVDFARRSSAAGANSLFDSITIGNDPVAMLTSTTTQATNGLSVNQLKGIYQCTITDWSSVGTGSGTIKPLLPQVGSGTRTYFLGQIGVTTPGSCVQNVEENDPEAIDGTGDPSHAIEPMSQSRLYLFQGKLNDGTSNGLGGYFTDPSCVGLATTPAACTTGKTLNPNVKLFNTALGAPAPTDGTALFNPTRPLYIYFRHADIASTKKFQPGGTLNWVRTMLYNPGGATPYFCGGAGQADIAAAGITPACVYTPGGP